MSYAFDSFGARIDEFEQAEVSIFVLGGEFDAYSAPGLEERLNDTIDRGRYELIVDLSDVSFIDMSTLNALLRAIKRVYQHNGRLLVVCESPPVLRAIDLAGMRHSIRVFHTRDEAFSELRLPPAIA